MFTSLTVIFSATSILHRHQQPCRSGCQRGPNDELPRKRRRRSSSEGSRPYTDSLCIRGPLRLAAIGRECPSATWLPTLSANHFNSLMLSPSSFTKKRTLRNPVAPDQRGRSTSCCKSLVTSSISPKNFHLVNIYCRNSKRGRSLRHPQGRKRRSCEPSACAVTYSQPENFTIQEICEQAEYLFASQRSLVFVFIASTSI